MSRSRITKRVVDGLQPGEGEYFSWDSDLAGFGLRVQPSGAKSYVVKYRAGTGRSAPTRRITLGSVGKLTPDQARAVARKTLGAVAQGADPVRERAVEKRSPTLRELAALFLNEHVGAKRKGSTADHYRGILDRLVLPKLGGRKAEKVTIGEMAGIHLELHDHPYQANRMLAVVGSMYSFGVKRKILPLGTNPVRGIEKYPERGRERFLSVTELARLGDAIREAETEWLNHSIEVYLSQSRPALLGSSCDTNALWACALLPYQRFAVVLAGHCAPVSRRSHIWSESPSMLDINRTCRHFRVVPLTGPIFSTMLERPFDLIFCGSLLTHLPETRFIKAIDWFCAALAPEG